MQFWHLLFAFHSNYFSYVVADNFCFVEWRMHERIIKIITEKFPRSKSEERRCPSPYPPTDYLPLTKYPYAFYLCLFYRVFNKPCRWKWLKSNNRRVRVDSIESFFILISKLKVKQPVPICIRYQKTDTSCSFVLENAWWFMVNKSNVFHTFVLAAI